MTSQVIAGHIHVTDIEELNAAVWPWRLRMNQLGNGQLSGDMDYAMVNDILLTHERWSHRLSAIGTTPPGYVAIAGSCTQKPFLVDGVEIASRSYVCKPANTNIEFVTPDTENHWVMLVPTDQIVDRFGEEHAALVLSSPPSQFCDPAVLQQLGNLVLRVIAALRSGGVQEADAHALGVFQSQLLNLLVCLLQKDAPDVDLASPKKRSEAALAATRLAGELLQPIGVDELAVRVGVSRRSLELGFRDTLNISPQKYLRMLRLNGLHRDLRHAAPGQATVAELATRWGFFELGRTAGQYKNLFGEQPSATLAQAHDFDVPRYFDALTAH